MKGKKKVKETDERGKPKKWCCNIQRALGIQGVSLDVVASLTYTAPGLALIWYFAKTRQREEGEEGEKEIRQKNQETKPERPRHC